MTRPAGTGDISRARKLGLTALAVLLAAALGAAVRAPAAMADCGAPSISGTLAVGSTVTAKAGSCSDPIPPNVQLTWYRCTGSTPATCTTQVKPAQSSPSAYTPTAADVGMRLGVKQEATVLLTEVDWRQTDVVPQPVGPPPPPPGGGDGGGGGNATPFMSPFPVVIVAGRLTRRGASVRRLSVRGPAGARVLGRCRGRSCPARRARKVIGPNGTARLRRFQRRLRARTVLEVLVTQPGVIGKYTRFRIRRGLPPKRVDMCVQPGEKTGSRCPV
jgi:hypothetical protein